MLRFGYAGALVLAGEAATAAEIRYIVTLRPGEDARNVSKEFGLKPRHIYQHALNGFSTALDRETVERLRSDKRVRAVSEDSEVRLTCTNSDLVVVPAGSFTTQQVPTGILRMGLPNFPMTRLTGQDHRINVDIAVLDTGIQLDHPDLNVYLSGSVSFADGSTNGSDWLGHGTHVAGICGALDNDIGVVGVAPGVRLWSVQIVGPNEHWVANLLAGVDYVAQHADEIAVINCSFIGSAGQNYDIVHEAFSNLVNRGVVVVAGAGNNSADISSDGIWGNEDDQLPAALPEVMAVSAIDPNSMSRFDPTNCVWLNISNPDVDRIPFFSNYSFIRHDPEFVHSAGAGIDVTAPGVHILSTYTGGDYAYWAGTSMATPHVAGLVALYISANGRATNAEGVYKIRQAIVDNSQPQTQWASYPNTGDPDGNPEPLALASENWVPQPNIFGIEMNGREVQLSFNIVPGYRYTVQGCASLGATNQWIDLMTTNGGGSLAPVSWSDSASGGLCFIASGGELRREKASRLPI